VHDAIETDQHDPNHDRQGSRDTDAELNDVSIT
jgi:hypothetical protein